MRENDKELKKFRMMLEEAELRLAKMAYQIGMDDVLKAIMAALDARDRVRRAESRMKEIGLDG